MLVDGSLSAAAASLELHLALEKAGPFGAGNPEPVFVFPAHRLIDVAPVGEGHLRWRAKAADGAEIGGILFRAAQEPLGLALVAARGQVLHLAGSLVCNRWNGRERMEVRLLDVAEVETGGGSA